MATNRKSVVNDNLLTDEAEDYSSSDEGGFQKRAVDREDKKLTKLRDKFDLISILKQIEEYDSAILKNGFLARVSDLGKRFDHHSFDSDIHYNSTGEQIIVDDKKA